MPTSTTGPACTARAAGATARCCRSSSAPKRYEGGESEYHGASGELGVSDLRNDHPYCAAWLAAGAEAGHPLTDDFNGAVSDGLGRYQLTLRGRWRCDAATAFLAPVRQRPNLDGRDRRAGHARRRRERSRPRRRVGRGRGAEERARRARGDPRGRRAAVAAAAAALGHRPGGAAAPPRHRRRRRCARGRRATCRTTTRRASSSS